jgi:integrase
MASVYKRPGQLKWYAKWKDELGKWQSRAESTDRAAALRAANHLEAEAMLRRDGVIDSAQDKLTDNAKRPLAEHVAEFFTGMAGKGDKPSTILDTRRNLDMALQGCGFTSIREIEATKMHGFITDLRRRGLGSCRINHLITTAKGFSRWLWRNGRLATDPLAQVDKLNAKADLRHERRALSDEELNWLIATTARSEEAQCMDGPTRALLYQLAVETGLRKSELRSLTPESFDLSGFSKATVTVLAAHAKNGRTDKVPMRDGLAQAVAAYLLAHPHCGRLFQHLDRASGLIQADLAMAKRTWIEEARGDKKAVAERTASGFLEYKDKSGRFADFHAMRHTFITRLARSGASPAEAKALARHSTIVLTMDHYTHLRVEDSRRALENLPELAPTKEERTGDATQRATKAM